MSVKTKLNKIKLDKIKLAAATVRCLLLLLIVAVGVEPSAAQQVLKASDAKNEKLSAKLFPLSEVRAGQRGIGRTVFAGSEPEEFDVEVLGVLDGFPAPRQSAIIARLSGEQVKRTGVFAGMSGSPVYIDGRLVGAVAFTFPFVKEPIAGITPIRFMLDIFATGGARADAMTDKSVAEESMRNKRMTNGGRISVSLDDLTATEWRSELRAAMQQSRLLAESDSSSAFAAFAGQQLTPIKTPIVFSGISADALARFAPQLEASGLLPVAGAGVAARITPLAPADERTLLPGTSVSVQLVRGDYSIAASGTVTLRDNEKIYAFGHPFLGAGSAQMPMTTASVVAVVPSAMNSFKLSVPGQMVGTIEQDRSTGIYGRLGASPRMIPVRVNLRTSREATSTYNFEVAHDEALTPLLLNLTLFSTITGSERSFGNATVSLHGSIETEAGEPVRIERRFAASNAAMLAAGSVAAPAGLLLNSGFARATIKGITLDIEALDGKQIAALDSITLDRDEARPGESVNLNAYLRTPAGETIVRHISLQIPADAAPGALLLFVGDGGALNRFSANALGGNFAPRSAAELVRLINDAPRNDRLYVKMFRSAAGAIVGARELPSLPPSVLATLTSERASGGFTATVLAGDEGREVETPAPFVVSGQQIATLSVVR